MGGTAPAGRLFVLTGPSGVGKDVVLGDLRQLSGRYHFPVTATTRCRRPGERDGVDYTFMSVDRFRDLIDRDGLLEWAEVHDNLYGVPRRGVTDALERGLDVVLKVDVQGAATVRRLHPEAVLIFLAPPDMDSLASRLRGRDTETPAELRVRLETARAEMEAASWFDHLVVNPDGRPDLAAAEIDRIVRGKTTDR